MSFYHSVLNRFTVYDAESFYPSIKALQDNLTVEYNRITNMMKISKKEVEISLSYFIEQERTHSDSSIARSLRNFYETANMRLSGVHRNNRRLPESQYVLPAIVSLNSLYEALHSRRHVEDVLAHIYMNRFLKDILEYVESQRVENNSRAMSLNTVEANNDPYGFGPFEMSVKKTRRRRAKSRRNIRL